MQLSLLEKVEIPTEFRNGIYLNQSISIWGKGHTIDGKNLARIFKKATGCSLCVDFAHLYAREQGKIDYGEVLKKLPT